MRMAQFNMADWLVDRHVREGGGSRTAVRSCGSSTTYEELCDMVARVGGALIGLGVRPVDRVLVVMLDSLEMAATILGATRIGAIPVLVNPMLSADDVAAVAVQADVRLAVVTREKVAMVAGLTCRTPDLGTVITTGDAELPVVDGVAVNGFDAALAGAEPVGPRFGSGEEPGFWLCTGGTTDRLKLVMHRQIDARLIYDTYASDVLGIVGADVCYSVAPMFHAFGLGNSLVFPLAAGATSVLVPTRPPTAAVVSATLAWEKSPH